MTATEVKAPPGGQAAGREKLTRLKVQGFKSIRAMDEDLTDLTILVGANGSGKSNLVQFFLMLSFMMSGRLQHFAARKGGGASLLHYGPRFTRAMDAELEFRGPAAISTYRFSLSFAQPDALLFTDEEVRFRRQGAAQPFTRHLDAGQKESALIQAAGASGTGTLHTVARVFTRRLQALRVYHFHDTSDEARIRTRQDLDRGGYLMTEAGNLAAFLHALREERASHFQRIMSTVRMVVPFLQDFILDPWPFPDSRQVLLRWSDRAGEEFGPHQLSDGSLRAIALITALLQPDELLPSVIVIDEPELGLHPGAVSLIGSLIRAAAKKTQVVVATQSPRLLAEFEPENVVVVERHEDDLHRGFSTFGRLSRLALGSWLKDYDLGSLYEMSVTGGGPG